MDLAELAVRDQPARFEALRTEVLQAMRPARHKASQVKHEIMGVE